jgi:hypothetical protein
MATSAIAHLHHRHPLARFELAGAQLDLAAGEVESRLVGLTAADRQRQVAVALDRQLGDLVQLLALVLVVLLRVCCLHRDPPSCVVVSWQPAYRVAPMSWTPPPGLG